MQVSLAVVVGERVFRLEVGGILSRWVEGSLEGCGIWDVCKGSFPRWLQVGGQEEHLVGGSLEEVSQGVVYQEEVSQGEASQGEVYQEEVYQGEV